MSNVQLPTVYVDLTTEVEDADLSGQALVLFNRAPEREEADVPTNAPIEFAVADLAIVGLASGTVTITSKAGVVIAWTLAGGFTATYLASSSFGSITSQGAGSPDEFRWQLVRSTAWVTDERVEVRVQLTPVAGAAIDITYFFLVEDVATPRFTTAKTRGLKTLIVEFNEPVQMDGDTGGALRVREVSGRMTFTKPSTIEIENERFPSAAIGDFLCFTGSEQALNNAYFEIATANLLNPFVVTTKETTVQSEAPILSHRGFLSAYLLRPVLAKDEKIPSFTPCIIAAEQIDSKTIKLTTDQALSPNRPYQLTAHGVADAADPANIATEISVGFIVEKLGKTNPRSFNLYDFIPDFNKKLDVSGDNERFVRIFDEVTQLLLADIDAFELIYDIDKAPLQFVDALLFHLGNPYTFLTTEEQKRKVLANLVQTYKVSGAEKAIEDAILQILGIPMNVFPLNRPAISWILGDSELGIDTILGTSDLRLRYSFEVISPVTLTETQRSIVAQIANTWRTAHTHFIRLIEPGSPIPP
jgi:phage tail-like protein